jgi:3-hydroxyisobutyrate dehydrogenase-like beta-hydroxyacid dehydrogenase
LGVAIAKSIVRGGHEVRYVPDGRSTESRIRAESAKLATSTLTDVVKESDIIVSVCPPKAAQSIASAVASMSYGGIYVDANAISPERTRSIAEMVQRAGATFVDGGIVGGPPKDRGECFLYLSGPEADSIASCFSNGLIESEVISDVIGDASALKMCYAAYTKGSTAMLLAITAAAENMGVRGKLFAQWKREGSGLDEAAVNRARIVTRKAWRWIDEMEEIANTFDSANLPEGFHRSAADIYRRIESLRTDEDELPEFTDVLNALSGKKTRG